MPESIGRNNQNHQRSVRFWESLIPISKGQGGLRNRRKKRKKWKQARKHSVSSVFSVYSVILLALPQTSIGLRHVVVIVYM